MAGAPWTDVHLSLLQRAYRAYDHQLSLAWHCEEVLRSIGRSFQSLRNRVRTLEGENWQAPEGTEEIPLLIDNDPEAAYDIWRQKDADSRGRSHLPQRLAHLHKAREPAEVDFIRNEVETAEEEDKPPPDYTHPAWRELARKLQKTRDVAKELGDRLVAAERGNVLFEELADVIRSETRPLDLIPSPPKIAIDHTTSEDLVAVFSDAHADQLIPAHRTIGIEDYDWVEFCYRFEWWMHVLVDWTQRHLKNHRFGRLWLLALGDNIVGDQHGGKMHSFYQNAAKGSLAVGDVLSQGVRNLTHYFDEIVVICLSGNHGRWAKAYDWRGAHEHFDYLVATQLATRLEHFIDEGRVVVHAPDAWSAVANIQGWNFLLSHGHEVKSWNSIPYYGIERKQRRMQALLNLNDVTMHYWVIGHFHTSSAGAQTPAGETFMNGSWMWTSEFAAQAAGLASKPFQLMFGVHKDHGVSWRLPISVSDYPESWLAREASYNQRVITDLNETDRIARRSGRGVVPIIR